MRTNHVVDACCVHLNVLQLPACFFHMPYRHCRYGGDDEYYVHVRETGNHQQENTRSDQTEEITQDW